LGGGSGEGGSASVTGGTAFDTVAKTSTEADPMHTPLGDA